MLLDAAVVVAKREPGRHPQLEAAIEQAKVSTREYAVWGEDTLPREPSEI